MGLFSSAPKITRNLVIINTVVFVLTFLSSDIMHNDVMYEKLALFYPKSPFFEFWQPLSYMFMHGGLWHLFLNMFTLLMFGSVIERYIGERKFIFLYFACGIFAAAAQMGVQAIEAASLSEGLALNSTAAVNSMQRLLATPTVGASGAIYGLLIAYVMMFPDSMMMLLFPPSPLKAKWMVLIFVIMELATGLTGTMGGVAHFAHLGGMLMGWLLVLYWRKRGTLFDRQ